MVHRTSSVTKQQLPQFATGDDVSRVKLQELARVVEQRLSSLERIAAKVDLTPATATLDFPNTAAGATSSLTVSVVGAVIGDPVTVGTTATEAGIFYGVTTATDTVTVYYYNSTAGAINPASATFKLVVFRVKA